MLENIALNKENQSKFSKSVKKMKNKIQIGNIVKGNIKKPRRQLNKGIVYISNIPHGFYEKELRGYFSQFGEILRLRVARSKRTGRCKGYAFIEFRNKKVAQIAAETMNNYLMDKRLIKAKYIPCGANVKKIFNKPNFSKDHYPTLVARSRLKKRINSAVSDQEYQKKVMKNLKQVVKVQKLLKTAGIDFKFTVFGSESETLLSPSNSDAEDQVKSKQIKLDKLSNADTEELVKSKKKNTKNSNAGQKNVKSNTQKTDKPKKKTAQSVIKDKKQKLINIQKNKNDIKDNLSATKTQNNKSKTKNLKVKATKLNSSVNGVQKKQDKVQPLIKKKVSKSPNKSNTQNEIKKEINSNSNNAKKSKPGDVKNSTQNKTTPNKKIKTLKKK